MSNVDTPVSHETHVRDLLIQLQAMRVSIPKLVFLPQPVARKMVAAASVPDRFLDKIAAFVEQNAEFQSTPKLPIASFRDVITFTAAYEQLATELEQFARSVRDMVLQERHDVAQEALRVYRVATTYNRAADRTELVPHVSHLREALGREPRTRTNEEPAPPATDTQAPPAGNSGANNGQGGGK